MNRIIPLRQALSDPAYFGGQLSGDSWVKWRVLLLSILGEPLDRAETFVFQELTGRPTVPAEACREFCGVAEEARAAPLGFSAPI
jgi:hypothetical protein